LPRFWQKLGVQAVKKIKKNSPALDTSRFLDYSFPMVKNLSSTENLLLASLVSADSKKKLASEMPDGSSVPVRVVLEFFGTLEKGVSYERTPTVSVPLIETLALFLARAGATREASEALLVECMTDAILETGKGQDALSETVPAVAAMLERVRANVLDKLPKVSVSGAVKFKGSVTELSAVTVNPEGLATVAELATIGQD